MTAAKVYRTPALAQQGPISEIGESVSAWIDPESRHRSYYFNVDCLAESYPGTEKAKAIRAAISTERPSDGIGIEARKRVVVGPDTIHDIASSKNIMQWSSMGEFVDRVGGDYYWMWIEVLA